MILYLPENIWKNQRGKGFRTPASYLKIGYHGGQDFHSNPVGTIPVTAPCDGHLTTFPFSKSAGWWGYFKFEHKGETYCLKLLHMYKQMKDGVYKKGDELGLCGSTGLSITQKHGMAYIGDSHEEQSSEKAVPHLHVELHKGEYQHDTNRVKELADERIIHPVSTFEAWVSEKTAEKEEPEPVVKEEKSTPIQNVRVSTSSKVVIKNKFATEAMANAIRAVIVRLARFLKSKNLK